MRFFLHIAVITILAFVCNAAEQVYISDIQGSVILNTQGWGELGIDEAVHLPGQKGLPLQIQEKSYSKGLGSHANSTFVLDLGGAYSLFESEVGIQKQENAKCSVVFKVLADGKEIFNSSTMTESTPAKPVNVSVAGAQELSLVVVAPGNDITYCAGNWADARLTRDPNFNAFAKSEIETVDIAPFGRVLTWDPNRMDGCRNNRFQDFTVEDLYPETDVVPDKGIYVVPVKNNIGCIGLQWLEQRRIKELGIQFAEATMMPATENVQVQYWVMTRQGGSPGGSVWQGRWENLDGKIEVLKDTWKYVIDWKNNTNRQKGTLKIRWLFPASEKKISIRQLSAFTDSKWKTADIILQSEDTNSTARGIIKMYNGEIIGSDSNSLLAAVWQLNKPMHLKVRYCTTTHWMTDRTVMRFELASGSFGVAVDDVLNGAVYVKEFGLFAAKKTPQTIDEYKQSIADKKTILQRVEEMPDQTFAQANENVHRAGADLGPTMLSLACDNQKYLVQRDGTINFYDSIETADSTNSNTHKLQRYLSQVRPTFGSGTSTDISRQLQGGWLPIVITTINDNGVIYRQRSFVAPYDFNSADYKGQLFAERKPVFVSQFIIENQQDKDANVSLVIKTLSDYEKNEFAELKPTPNGAVAYRDNKPFASLVVSNAAGLKYEIKEGNWMLSGRLSANGKAECSACIPGWNAAEDEIAAMNNVEKLASDTEAYWKQIMIPTMSVEIPDVMLQNLITASQVHCTLAARNEDYNSVAAWIASSDYGPLESEAQSVIRGMQFTGNYEFARKAHEFFIKRYNKEGFVTPTYTVMGTGWHLWCVSEYYELTKDKKWVKENADEIARVCKWIMNTREKTKRTDTFGNKVPEWGLMPPGTMADWEVFNFYYYMNGFYYAGLNAAGRMLKDIGYPGAQTMIDNAAELRECIVRAYHWTQSQSPVYPLQDGTWVPAYPTHVYCPSPIDNFYKGEDGGRSWAYDVEVGSHHLVPLGVTEPDSKDSHWTMNHMEDVQFMGSGWGYDGYSSDKNYKDWFNLGGFAKVQPFYARTTEVYALEDNVKAFIRSYFNSTITLLNREDLSLWEHFHNGAYNKTHETGYFLYQSRLMFAMERGDELWLAPFVPAYWMQDGQKVVAKNVPTYFGTLNYKIKSFVGGGYIEVIINPPVNPRVNNNYKSMVLRLRHPEGKPIKSVVVDGKEYKDFDSSKDIIRLSPTTAKEVVVRACY